MYRKDRGSAPSLDPFTASARLGLFPTLDLFFLLGNACHFCPPKRLSKIPCPGSRCKPNVFSEPTRLGLWINFSILLITFLPWGKVEAIRLPAHLVDIVIHFTTASLALSLLIYRN